MLIMAGMNRQSRDGSDRTQAKANPIAGKEAAPRLPLAEEEITRPTFRRERAALKRGVWPIAGCDEAGRGPLAGPVVAEASKAGLQVSSLTQIMLLILILGAGTDYGLFLVFRVREELRTGRNPHDAVAHSLARVGE